MADPLVTRGRGRGKRWTPVTRGVHRLTAAPDPWLADLHGWQLLLPPSARFTGLTAARVRGWHLPVGLPELPVFVAMPYRATAPVRPGLHVTRHRQTPPGRPLQGLRLATPSESLLAAATLLELLDLVILVDGALRSGDVELLELWAIAGQHRRGAPRLRKALLLADGGSESVMETMLRLLHVSTGIEVRTQHKVFDAEGRFVARGDVWPVGSVTLQEYDGAHHRERDQQDEDRRRDRAVNRAGWLRNGYVYDDLVRRPETVLADADRAIGRSHDPRRGRAWQDLLAGASCTASGRRALEVRAWARWAA